MSAINRHDTHGDGLIENLVPVPSRLKLDSFCKYVCSWYPFYPSAIQPLRIQSKFHTCFFAFCQRLRSCWMHARFTRRVCSSTGHLCKILQKRHAPVYPAFGHVLAFGQTETFRASFCASLSRLLHKTVIQTISDDAHHAHARISTEKLHLQLAVAVAITCHAVLCFRSAVADPGLFVHTEHVHARAGHRNQNVARNPRCSRRRRSLPICRRSGASHVQRRNPWCAALAQCLFNTALLSQKLRTTRTT